MAMAAPWSKSRSLPACSAAVGNYGPAGRGQAGGRRPNCLIFQVINGRLSGLSPQGPASATPSPGQPQPPNEANYGVVPRPSLATWKGHVEWHRGQGSASRGGGQATPGDRGEDALAVVLCHSLGQGSPSLSHT